MASILASLQTKIKEIYGEDSLNWLDRSYVVDWVVAVGLLLLSQVFLVVPVFERDFSIDDPLINHPHTHQRISGTMNWMVSVVVPVGISGFVGGIRGSVPEIHHALLASFSGRAISELVTEAMKNRVGRLRPDFLARCAWNAATAMCTGDPGDITDGRRSFPSGHSSTAFVGMTFLTLFLAGKTTAFCFVAPAPPGAWLGSRMARLTVTLSPLVFAAWVAITRVEDYRHHKEDVIVGSLIGAISATITYLIFWPSPFSAQSFTADTAGRPRLVYTSHEVHRRRNGGYELTRLDNDVEVV
ncbi:lipid phosphate phosphatase 1 [Artomyces pyxidatus]|uniref:Lipid phosphate phosphatase 1 n=1 Tax=Artomyces pyxidatus TaxID=48021 RepID=A0ACB8SWQ9_9AGAM|nr:lipid phosphate phosphatase 1 [Artomyces pyxidatus]